MISKLYKTDKWLMLVAVCVSLALSLWANIADDVVNNDGVEYIKSARAILAGDWTAAVQTYKWPFYSGVIALTSGVTGLSLTHSAYAVNALCYAWLVLGFISLVQLLGGRRSTLWFAVLVILAFPAVNKFRPYLIRDPAFLALFLNGCYAYFNYVKTGAARHNVIAVLCFSVAALFRIEGLIYLCVTQGYLLHQRFIGKGSRILSAVVFVALLLLLVVFLSWWQFTPTKQLGYDSILTQPVEIITAAWRQILLDMNDRLEVIESHILVGYSRSYSIVVLFWSAISIVLLKLMHALHYLYFVLLLIAWRKGLLFPEGALCKPWRFLIQTALLILFGFVLAKWFLSARYVIPVALLLLLATPFLLSSWYDDVRAGGRKAKLWIVLALVVLAGLKSLDLSTKKHYLKEAAEWMDRNIPDNASVYTNNRILGHYFERITKVDPYWPTWQSFMTGSVLARQHLDYGAINIKHTNASYIKNIPILLERKIIAEFVNEKGSRIIVFDFGQMPEAVKPEKKYVK